MKAGLQMMLNVSKGNLRIQLWIVLTCLYSFTHSTLLCADDEHDKGKPASEERAEAETNSVPKAYTDFKKWVFSQKNKIPKKGKAPLVVKDQVTDIDGSTKRNLVFTKRTLADLLGHKEKGKNIKGYIDVLIDSRKELDSCAKKNDKVASSERDFLDSFMKVLDKRPYQEKVIVTYAASLVEAIKKDIEWTKKNISDDKEQKAVLEKLNEERSAIIGIAAWIRPNTKRDSEMDSEKRDKMPLFRWKQNPENDDEVDGVDFFSKKKASKDPLTDAIVEEANEVSTAQKDRKEESKVCWMGIKPEDQSSSSSSDEESLSRSGAQARSDESKKSDGEKKGNGQPTSGGPAPALGAGSSGGSGSGGDPLTRPGATAATGVAGGDPANGRIADAGGAGGALGASGLGGEAPAVGVDPSALAQLEAQKQLAAQTGQQNFNAQQNTELAQRALETLANNNAQQANAGLELAGRLAAANNNRPEIITQDPPLQLPQTSAAPSFTPSQPFVPQMPQFGGMPQMQPMPMMPMPAPITPPPSLAYVPPTAAPMLPSGPLVLPSNNQSTTLALAKIEQYMTRLQSQMQMMMMGRGGMMAGGAPNVLAARVNMAGGGMMRPMGGVPGMMGPMGSIAPYGYNAMGMPGMPMPYAARPGPYLMPPPMMALRGLSAAPMGVGGAIRR